MNCFVRLAASVNSPERQPVTENKVDEVRAAFVRSPRKSAKLTTGKLNMPHTTVHRTPQKSFKCKGHWHQLLRNIIAKNKEVRYTFCYDFFQTFEMNISQIKLSSVLKPHSIYQEMLIAVTQEYGGAKIVMKPVNIRKTVQSRTCGI
jgi:hypothetical protein